MNSLKGERIHSRALFEEMSESYLDYSMSVIVQRALPDVRDGLKPVHRRILYGMNELGLNAGKRFKKSARVVGDVMGKYHPHGDSAIYDALVRMAQTFSMRYPLVDGQGNFGSIDGDSAAAMRYTEARMHKFADELMIDIDKETVDFQPNYDDSLKEPTTLPTRLPNLLVNGSSGIAVGMATNVPPHNLGEIVGGLIAMIDNPEITLAELVQHIPGPDFPTGGIIYGMNGVHETYSTGRGRIIVRARVVVETPKTGRVRIVILEIPYQVNKSKLIERTAELVNDKKIVGIADIRDESDRDGMRVVIELKRDAVPEVILNNMYAHTQLQTTFGAIMLALVDGVPKVMGLKEMLEHFIAFRLVVIERRTRYELKKAKERAHIFEGLKIAVDNLEEVIKIIRSSPDTPTARERLIERFGLSLIQAKEILDMRLARLTGLERQKIIDELRTLKELIVELEGILSDNTKRLEIVKEELIEVRDKFDDERRTELVNETGEFTVEDMIAEEDMVISVTSAGYIKRFPVSGYKRQKRGGKGLSGHHPKEEDIIRHMFVASTHNYLMFFTDRGKCHWLKVHELPSLGRAARGKPIINLINIEPGEKVAAMLNVSGFDEDHFIFFATRHGVVKKTPLSAFKHPNKRGIIAIKIDGEDSLVNAGLTDGTCSIILGSSTGKAVHFKEKDVRAMGRNAAGVRGMALSHGQHVVGMVVMQREGTLLIVTERGYGKRSHISEYRMTRRGAQGVMALRTTPKTGPMISIMEVVDSDDLFIMTSSGMMIRQKVDDIRTIGRVTQGVRLIRLNKGDGISDVSPVPPEDDDDTEKPIGPDQANLFEADPDSEF